MKNETGNDEGSSNEPLVQDAYDGTLFFYHHPKVMQRFLKLSTDRDICLTFSNPTKTMCTFSLSGKAKISEDQQLIGSILESLGSRLV